MSTITSSPSASDFLYGPQASFETSDFAMDSDDPGFMDRLYADSMPEYEPAAIDAGIDQTEAYANDPAYHAEQLARESRTEIQTMTAAEERRRAAERQMLIDFAAHVGRNLQDVRDMTRRDA